MNVMEFYPSKFCLITDLLDTFGKRYDGWSAPVRSAQLDSLGKLVYTRMLEKSASSNGKIRNYPVPFRWIEGSEWRFISSRSDRTWPYSGTDSRNNSQLVLQDRDHPGTTAAHSRGSCHFEMLQFLVHKVPMSTMWCSQSTHFFFSHYQSALVRLMKMCRGIGDPLLAAYARCYICRVNSLVIEERSEPLNQKPSVSGDPRYRFQLSGTYWSGFCRSMPFLSSNRSSGSQSRIYIAETDDQCLLISVFTSLGLDRTMPSV